ncbi:MAG: 4Fe-4S binding protein [Holosporales bacterium]|jgi:ferredoxin|nr:4Fe-4S binding protein [Holosporales bacterium]
MMNIRKLIKLLFLIDPLRILFFGIRTAFKKPVTIKRLSKLEKKCINVNPKNCTKCLVCLSICPCKAINLSLRSGKIKINEKRCAQCGLCQQACPKYCITKKKQNEDRGNGSRSA